MHCLLGFSWAGKVFLHPSSVLVCRPKKLTTERRRALSCSCRCATSYGGWEWSGDAIEWNVAGPSEESERRALVVIASSIVLFSGLAWGRKWTWLVGLAGLAVLATTEFNGDTFSGIDRALEGMFRDDRKGLDWLAIHACIAELEELIARARVEAGAIELEGVEQGVVKLKALLASSPAVVTVPEPATAKIAAPPMEVADNEGVTAEAPPTVEVAPPPPEEAEEPSPPPAEEPSLLPAEEPLLLPAEEPPLLPAEEPSPPPPEVTAPTLEVWPMAEGGAALASVLKRAQALVKLGQEAADMQEADGRLAEACRMLGEASRANPENLVAVGMHANALLVHGQLKLRAVEQLQRLVSDGAKKSRREEIEMQRVADGCEELLLQAGRSYRKALTLCRDDVRALYNWGLALCCRARLISFYEEEEEDADKVYLAAIDKFEALAGMGDRRQAAGAVYKWGVTVRDRALLRPWGSQERWRLLLQAKELLEDAARLGFGEAAEREMETVELELNEI